MFNMKKFLSGVALFISATWPASAWATCVGQVALCTNATAVLGLCRPADAETAWGAPLRCMAAEIDTLFHASTGHNHNGTGTNGPQLGTGALSFDVTTQVELDAHKSSTDHDSRYCLLAGCTMTGSILAPDGTAGAPAYSLSGDSDSGFYRKVGSSGRVVYSRNGQELIGFGGVGLSLGNGISGGTALSWTPGSNVEATPDLQLWRDAAGQLGQRIVGSTAGAPKPQAHFLYYFYDTGTSPTSYNALAVGYDSAGHGILETQFAGANGTASDLYVGPQGNAFLYWRSGGASFWKMGNAGHILAVNNNTNDIGDGSTGDPRNIYARTSIQVTTANGGKFGTLPSAGQTITLSTVGTTTASSITVPQYAIMESVLIRVTTTITGSGVTGFTVKLTNNAQECQNGTSVALTAGTTNKGSKCSGIVNAHSGADTLTITAVGGTPTAGAVKIIPIYKDGTPPTS